MKKYTPNTINETQNIEYLIKLLNSNYDNYGYTLKDLYNQVKDAYGSVHGPAIFSEFALRRKKDKKFMDEFNKTSFI